MADPENPRTLAAKLRDHADGIVDLDQQEMEADIRAAATMLDYLDTAPKPLLVRIMDELRSIAEFADAGTRRRLETLIGDT